MWLLLVQEPTLSIDHHCYVGRRHPNQYILFLDAKVHPHYLAGVGGGSPLGMARQQEGPLPARGLLPLCVTRPPARADGFLSECLIW